MTDTLPAPVPEWVEFEKVLGGPNQLSLDSAQACREQFGQMFAAMAAAWPPKPDSIKEEVVHITPEQYIKIYSPSNAQEPLPVGLYIHCGGGFAGAVEFEDGLCRDIVQRSKIILFSPFYRLAPENPFPAGVDDVCAAYEWMHHNAPKYGGDAKRKAIMGGSAGGNLSVSVAVKYAAHPTMRPAALLVGAMASCDLKALPAEYAKRLNPKKYADVPMFSQDAMAVARGWLNAPPNDPLQSPLLHPDLKHLPRTYVTTGTNDATYQETLFFYEECKKQGVLAELKEFVGYPHFFWIIPSLTGTEEFQKLWCEKLDEYMEAALSS